jgi:hypothetical protein
MSTLSQGNIHDVRPPETIDEPPISLGSAARLMDAVGFAVFRTPPAVSLPDSCLMVVLHDTPTGRHFDADRVSFWSFEEGHGQLAELDRSMQVPFSTTYSWGRIRMVDRFGARNSFVSFGGTLTGELVGNGARLLIFRSPATIFRLAGHSQRQDRLAEEAIAFFAELIPHLWADGGERMIAAMSPRELYAAFLLHLQTRVSRSRQLRDVLADDERALRRELALLTTFAPDCLRAGERLLQTIDLTVR